MAEETEGTKNVSTPVIVVDDATITSVFNPITAPGGPTGTADYNLDGTNYYTSVGSDTYTSTVDQNFTADLWAADWVTELVNGVVADVKWGDNLLSHVFSGSGGQPIRVEVNLFADATMAAVYGDMNGYATVSLEGTNQNELFGTLGVAEVLTPLVYTPKATLTILQYDPNTRWYSIQVMPPTPMTGEVNGSGKLIYGFNWGSPSGLANPTVGNYRLIFTVADDSLVTFDEALAAVEETTVAAVEPAAEEGSTHPAFIYGDKVSYLDIPLGTELLSPALPYAVEHDMSGDHKADIVAKDAAGSMYVYPGDGAGRLLPRTLVGSGYGGLTAIVAPGDFNGDGKMDLVARDTTGRLYLYPGNGKGGFTTRVAYGTGWNAMTKIAAVDDFNGDGHSDLITTDSLGKMWLYPGDGNGSWLPRVGYGYGWNAMNAIVGTGDWNGDGNADLLARDKLGQLWLYPGNGTGGWLTRVLAGWGWGSMTALAAPGDFNGDGFADLLARNSTGQLLLYRGNGTGGFITPPMTIASGWNALTLVVS